MSITGTKRLYDYTRGLASGVTIAEANIKSILPNLYLENKELFGDLAPLVYEGDFPNRFPQAYDNALNLIGESFGVTRGPNETDDAYRQKLKLSIIQSPTTSGIINSVNTLFSGLGLNVETQVFDAHESFFDAVNTNFDNSFRGTVGARSFRIEIEISPSLRSSYPNYLDSFLSNSYYDIVYPGNYSIYFNPFGVDSIDLNVTVNNTQFPFREEIVYTKNDVAPGEFFDLGFLSNFQQIKVVSSDSSYESYLTLNQSSFDFYVNPDYNSLLTSFGVSFLREVFQNTLAFGIIIERIIVRQAGSGG